MEYNNLDAILERTEKFDQMGEYLLEGMWEDISGLEIAIGGDERLKKFFKIIKILKNSKFSDFDFELIKNMDPNFKWDDDTLVVKFSDYPIELTLQKSDDLRSGCLAYKFINDAYVSDFDVYNFYNKVYNYIPTFEQNFIKIINNILKQQDALYKKFYIGG